MISMSIKHNFPDVQRELGRISDELKRDKATSMALNKVGAKGKTAASRYIRQNYEMRMSDVNPKLSITKASRGHLVVTLEPLPGSRGRSQNVIRFLEKKVTMAEVKRRRKTGTLSSVHKLKGRSVTNPILHFKIRKGEAAKRIHGAFVGNKGRTIFRRTGKSRLPIEPIYTIDVIGMFGAKRVLDAVMERINEELPVEMERAIRLVLRA